MKGLKGLVLSLVGMGLTISITACDSEGHKDFSSSEFSVASMGGVAAYKATMWNFTQQQNCKMCHNTAVNPYFASADINTAYSFASKMVDFNNPTLSKFIDYAGNGHCGADPCSNPANKDVVKNLLIQWASAETGGAPVSGLPSYMTATMPLPATIPSITAAQPAVLRFQLSALSTPVASLSKAILEIEVQKVNLTNYRVNRIKIAGNTAAVRIQGVHVYVKPVTDAGIGGEDMAQGDLWNTLDATAAVFALPAKLPTTPLTATPLSTTALNIEAKSAADALTIGIEVIQ